jgi:hypothetical protein
MSDLHEKLKDLWLDAKGSGINQDDFTAEVEQAFKDAGWFKQHTSSPEAFVELVGSMDRHLSNLMTGQEWYDRFEKELLLYFDEDGDYPKHLDGYKTAALFNIAKKAAGIE